MDVYKSYRKKRRVKNNCFHNIRLLCKSHKKNKNREFMNDFILDIYRF